MPLESAPPSAPLNASLAQAGDCRLRNASKPVLRIQHLSKFFGPLAILQDLHIHVGHGERVALLGPSGCGKSTIFNLVSGLDTTYSGEIFLNGQERRSSAMAPAYMLQKDLLLPWRNIEDNINLPRELGKIPTRSPEEIRALYHLFGLAEFRKSFPDQLSGGMRQRANLLRSYSLDSELLLLDEPFGSLDSLSKTKLHNWFLQVHRQTPRSILLVTHDILEAITLCERIYVLSQRPATNLAEFQVDHKKTAQHLELFKEISSLVLAEESEL